MCVRGRVRLGWFDVDECERERVRRKGNWNWLSTLECCWKKGETECVRKTKMRSFNHLLFYGTNEISSPAYRSGPEEGKKKIKICSMLGAQSFPSFARLLLPIKRLWCCSGTMGGNQLQKMSNLKVTTCRLHRKEASKQDEKKSSLRFFYLFSSRSFFFVFAFVCTNSRSFPVDFFVDNHQGFAFFVLNSSPTKKPFWASTLLPNIVILVRIKNLPSNFIWWGQ